MKELISVIIPVYNVERYLKKCVNSILNQTYQNIEVILVDDGSLDSSGVICDQLKEQDTRVHVIHKKNGGLSDARNAGLEQANGDYYYFIDSDDFVDMTILEELYSNLVKTKADISLCDLIYCDEDMKNLNEIYHHQNIPTVVLSKKEYWNLLMKDENAALIVAWNKLYKKEIFQKLRYPVNKLHEDEFILQDIIEQCDSICMVGKPLYYYLQRKNSIMGASSIHADIDKVEALFRRALYFFESSQDFFAQKTLKLGMQYYSGIERKLSDKKDQKIQKKLKSLKHIYNQIVKKFFWKKFDFSLKGKSIIWSINPNMFYQLGQLKSKLTK